MNMPFLPRLASTLMAEIFLHDFGLARYFFPTKKATKCLKTLSLTLNNTSISQWENVWMDKLPIINPSAKLLSALTQVMLSKYMWWGLTDMRFCNYCRKELMSRFKFHILQRKINTENVTRSGLKSQEVSRKKKVDGIILFVRVDTAGYAWFRKTKFDKYTQIAQR